MIPPFARVAILAIAAIAAEACDSSSVSPNGPLGLDPTNPDPSEVCRDSTGAPLPVAPDSLRVDLGTPAFSHSTSVTNPLFPIGTLFRAVFYGYVEGAPLRLETTLLPETRVITVDGQRVETLRSQFVAWVDGRINEVAIDHYAQADDGAVWYFGEDVFNYEDGSVLDTEGTWLAGRDGPPAMIMPANPQVGNVWRTENICDVAFEQVTALVTGQTVESAHGAVSGAMTVQELHQDGALEEKVFTPGYGEWTSGGGQDLEALVLAIPSDALPGLPPKELVTLSQGATGIFDAAEAEDWEAASATAGEMTSAWNTFKAGGVPPRIDTLLQASLDTLSAAIDAQAVDETRQATLRVALPVLDLELRHRTAAETDLDLMDVWARQLILDAAAQDQTGMIGDAASLRWIRDRIARDVSPADLERIDTRLRDLQAAAAANSPSRARSAVAGFRATVAATQVDRVDWR